MKATLDIILSDINIWAILVCVVINQMIGAFWYSPLAFGKAWAKEVGIDIDKIDKKDANKRMLFAALLGILIALILSIFVYVVDVNVWFTGAILGALLGLLVAIVIGTIYLFEGKTMRQYLINVLYVILSFAVQGAVLAVWH